MRFQEINVVPTKGSQEEAEWFDCNAQDPLALEGNGIKSEQYQFPVHQVKSEQDPLTFVDVKSEQDAPPSDDIKSERDPLALDNVKSEQDPQSSVSTGGQSEVAPLALASTPSKSELDPITLVSTQSKSELDPLALVSIQYKSELDAIALVSPQSKSELDLLSLVSTRYNSELNQLPVITVKSELDPIELVATVIKSEPLDDIEADQRRPDSTNPIADVADCKADPANGERAGECADSRAEVKIEGLGGYQDLYDWADLFPGPTNEVAEPAATVKPDWATLFRVTDSTNEVVVGQGRVGEASNHSASSSEASNQSAASWEASNQCASRSESANRSPAARESTAADWSSMFVDRSVGTMQRCQMSGTEDRKPVIHSVNDSVLRGEMAVGRRPSWGEGTRLKDQLTERRHSWGVETEIKPSWGVETERRPSWGVETERGPSWGVETERRPSWGVETERRPSWGEGTILRDQFTERRPSWGVGTEKRPSWGVGTERRPSWGEGTERRPSWGEDPGLSDRLAERRPGWGVETERRPTGGEDPGPGHRLTERRPGCMEEAPPIPKRKRRPNPNFRRLMQTFLKLNPRYIRPVQLPEEENAAVTPPSRVAGFRALSDPLAVPGPGRVDIKTEPLAEAVPAAPDPSALPDGGNVSDEGRDGGGGAERRQYKPRFRGKPKVPEAGMKRCSACGRHFPHTWLWCDHVLTAHCGVLCCAHCDAVFTSPWLLCEHELTHEGPFACPQCGLALPAPHAYAVHVLAGCYPLQCVACGRHVGDRGEMGEHWAAEHVPLVTYQGELQNPAGPISQHGCPLCLKDFPDDATLARHGVAQHDAPWSCRKCALVFKAWPGFMRHVMEDKHPIYCTKCGKQCWSEKQLSRHVSYEHDGPYRCMECIESFADRTSWREHSLTHQARVRLKLTCGECGKTYASKHYLRFHIKTKHITGPESLQDIHQCPTCKRLCPNRKTLRSHFAHVHSGVRPHVCPHCPKRFIHPKMRDAHAAWHARPDVGCTRCSKRFPTRPLLHRHMCRAHKGASVCQCATCGAQFFGKKHLVEHLQAAGGCVPQHMCDVCRPSRPFPNLGRLNAHMLWHGSAEYACAHCAKPFKTSQQLQKHEYIHFEDKPYKCPKCPKSYAQSCNFMYHSRATHGITHPFPCAQCGEAFTHTSHLMRHARDHHATQLRRDERLAAPGRAAVGRRSDARSPPVVMQADTTLPVGATRHDDTKLTIDMAMPIGVTRQDDAALPIRASRQADTRQRDNTTQLDNTMRQGDLTLPISTKQQDDTTKQGNTTQQENTTLPSSTTRQDDTIEQDNTTQPISTKQRAAAARRVGTRRKVTAPPYKQTRYPTRR